MSLKERWIEMIKFSYKKKDTRVPCQLFGAVININTIQSYYKNSINGRQKGEGEEGVITIIKKKQYKSLNIFFTTTLYVDIHFKNVCQWNISMFSRVYVYSSLMRLYSFILQYTLHSEMLGSVNGRSILLQTLILYIFDNGAYFFKRKLVLLAMYGI